tara:strand:+ start:217 stop:666 length:450 start_codon:yes stop_codon:yes gene_type:complete
MPRLGLFNTASKFRSRKPKRLLFAHFTSDTASFTGNLTNANVSASGGSLLVIPSAGDGYAHRTLTVEASTKYHIRIKKVVSTASTGKLTLTVGTSAGATDLLSLLTPDNQYYSGSFTTGGSTTTVHIGLMVEVSSQICYWDDLLVETWD